MKIALAFVAYFVVCLIVLRLAHIAANLAGKDFMHTGVYYTTLFFLGFAGWLLLKYAYLGRELAESMQGLWIVGIVVVLSAVYVYDWLQSRFF